MLAIAPGSQGLIIAVLQLCGTTALSTLSRVLNLLHTHRLRPQAIGRALAPLYQHHLIPLLQTISHSRLLILPSIQASLNWERTRTRLPPRHPTLVLHPAIIRDTCNPLPFRDGSMTAVHTRHPPPPVR